jgi:hypothetical protein
MNMSLQVFECSFQLEFLFILQKKWDNLHDK